ncbi:MAG TPA: MarR family winged helix-turn-helix transcriptional regulator [Candidatus Microsaccharimonas sp.]|nr:MarR family winged helix-turn-helix transcriptional regulator [Candidatus Microsaccharimonas sp.]
MPETPQLIHSMLHHLSAVFARESDQILQEQLGIGLSQFKILDTLIENSAMQQRHIALQLGQTEASVSRQIKLLQQKSMVETMRNPVNRREHITTLTPRGERITEAAQNVLSNFQSSALEDMPDKQQTQLLALLARVHK